MPSTMQASMVQNSARKMLFCARGTMTATRVVPRAVIETTPEMMPAMAQATATPMELAAPPCSPSAARRGVRMADLARKLHRTATTIATKTEVPIPTRTTCHRMTRVASGISGRPTERSRSCLSLPIRLMIRANRMAKQADIPAV